MATTQAEALCRQLALCGGVNLSKEQLINLVPALLCQISNTSMVGFLCDPSTGLPVVLRYTFNPGAEVGDVYVTALAFNADGSVYTDDIALLEACSGGGSGPATLDEVVPEELVSFDGASVTDSYQVGMTSANAKRYVSIWNTTDGDIIISNDGVIDFQIVGINQNLKLDLGAEGSKWSTDIFIRGITGSEPTSGTLYISAFH